MSEDLIRDMWEMLRLNSDAEAESWQAAIRDDRTSPDAYALAAEMAMRPKGSVTVSLPYRVTARCISFGWAT